MFTVQLQNAGCRGDGRKYASAFQPVSWEGNETVNACVCVNTAENVRKENTQ